MQNEIILLLMCCQGNGGSDESVVEAVFDGLLQSTIKLSPFKYLMQEVDLLAYRLVLATF
jgi:hypothetical protein